MSGKTMAQPAMESEGSGDPVVTVRASGARDAPDAEALSGIAAAERLLEAARRMRLTFCLFPKDLTSPDLRERDSARLMYCWLPELARRNGACLSSIDQAAHPEVGISDIERMPDAELFTRIGRDLEPVREYARWLGPEHVKGDVALVLLPGRDSILQAAIDDRARAGRVAPSSVIERPTLSGGMRAFLHGVLERG